MTRPCSKCRKDVRRGWGVWLKDRLLCGPCWDGHSIDPGPLFESADDTPAGEPRRQRRVKTRKGQTQAALF